MLQKTLKIASEKIIIATKQLRANSRKVKIDV